MTPEDLLQKIEECLNDPDPDRSPCKCLEIVERAMREAEVKGMEWAATYAQCAHGAGSHTKPQEIIAAGIRAEIERLEKEKGGKP